MYKNVTRLCGFFTYKNNENIFQVYNTFIFFYVPTFDLYEYE